MSYTSSTFSANIQYHIYMNTEWNNRYCNVIKWKKKSYIEKNSLSLSYNRSCDYQGRTFSALFKKILERKLIAKDAVSWRSCKYNVQSEDTCLATNLQHVQPTYEFQPRVGRMRPIVQWLHGHYKSTGRCKHVLCALWGAVIEGGRGEGREGADCVRCQYSVGTIPVQSKSDRRAFIHASMIRSKLICK